MSELCLTLLCQPDVEEKLLDLLLMQPSQTVFTSTRTAAHGLPHEYLDQGELVQGRGRATEIKVLIAAADKDALLALIRQQFSGTGLSYWITPLIEAGEIV